MNIQDYIKEKSVLDLVSGWTMLSIKSMDALKINDETYQFTRVLEFKEGILLVSGKGFDLDKWVTRLVGDTVKYRIDGTDYKYTGLVVNLCYFVFERIQDAEIIPMTTVSLSR